jgi:hypothetical protein
MQINIGLSRVKVIIWCLFLQFLVFLTPLNALAQVIANAGSDQAVHEGDTVTLSSAGSSSGPRQWTQTGGPGVVLSFPTFDTATFTAPTAEVKKIVTLTFQLEVRGETGSATDLVNVFVCPAGALISNIPAGLANAGLPMAITISHGKVITSTVNDPNVYSNTAGYSIGTRPDQLPNGLTDVIISSTAPFTTTITFYLPTTAATGYGWAKLKPSQGWLDMSNRVLFSPDRSVVSMTVTDNGDTDDDSTPNIIRDPSGLALMPSSSSSGSGGSGGCFIATAAFGSYAEPHVEVLRDFRDRILLKDSLGRAFVSLYYKLSPPIADCIARHETLKILVRWSLLPIVGISWIALKIGALFVLGLMVLIIMLTVKFIVTNYKRLPKKV